MEQLFVLILISSVLFVISSGRRPRGRADADIDEHGHPHSFHHPNKGRALDSDTESTATCENAQHAPFMMPNNDDDGADSSRTDSVQEIRINKYYSVMRDRFYIRNTGYALEFQLDDNSTQMAEVAGGYPFGLKVTDARIRGPGWGDEYVLAKGVFHWQLKNLTMRNPDGTTVFNTNSTSPPLEMELVHYALKYGSLEAAATKSDGIIITGHLFELVGRDNPALEPIARSALSVTFPTVKLKQVHGPLDIKLLYPSELSYCQFTGMYPLNPCAHQARFLVFKRPTFVSARQLKRFGALRGEDGTRISERTDFPPPKTDDDYNSSDGAHDDEASTSSQKCTSSTIYLTVVSQHSLPSDADRVTSPIPKSFQQLKPYSYAGFVLFLTLKVLVSFSKCHIYFTF